MVFVSCGKSDSQNLHGVYIDESLSCRGKLVCFDSKTIFLVARLFFATGNALTAAAPSMNAFIIGRAITGIGNGGTYVTIIIIITHLTPRTEQGRYFGYIGFAWGLGTM